jgi:hypothetical protein
MIIHVSIAYVEIKTLYSILSDISMNFVYHSLQFVIWFMSRTQHLAHCLVRYLP